MSLTDRYPLEGMIGLMTESHRPEPGDCGCSCGFCVWSPAHVTIMAYRAAVDAEA